MKTRVVVTGMGAITPIGNDVESFWQALKDKTLGIGPITYFDTADFKCKLAAEVKDFDAKAYMDPKTCLLYTSYQEKFGTYSGLVLTEAGAIALGIILASHMARFFISLKSHLRSRGNKKRESNRRI